jgi:hypothetical protein
MRRSRSTLSAKRVFRSTLQLGSTEFSKLRDRELSSQPCNQEASSFPALSSGKSNQFHSSGRIDVNPAIRKDRGQSCKIMKVKKEEKKSSSSEKLDQTLSSRRKERRTLLVENS